MTLDIGSEVDLSSLNTLGLKSTAYRYIEVYDSRQLPQLLHYSASEHLPVLWLGGGSNLVLGEYLQAVVARICIKGIDVVDRSPDTALVEVGAGEIWHNFVQWCVSQNLFGLENLALIPGTAGAAPVQNIGAYGVEIAERIDSVEVFDTEHTEFTRLNVSQCRFGYRDSVFKRQPGRFVITRIRLRLDRHFHPVLGYAPLAQRFSGQSVPDAQAVFDAVCEIRRSKLPDPTELGNAGSFFKNPVVSMATYEKLLSMFPTLPSYPAEQGRKLAAGWLIEQAGLKGYRMGRVGVHRLQALVLVNYGGACRAEVEALAAYVRAQVKDRFGVELEQEPVAYPAK